METYAIHMFGCPDIQHCGDNPSDGQAQYTPQPLHAAAISPHNSGCNETHTQQDQLVLYDDRSFISVHIRLQWVIMNIIYAFHI